MICRPTRYCSNIYLLAVVYDADCHSNDVSPFDPLIEGTIPPSLKNLTRVYHLDASKNNFDGPFPEFLSDLPELSYLFLGYNDFEGGPIPESFSKLTKMEELSLKGTNRTGPIPSFIGESYENLRLLDLDKNDFSGELPESLGNLEKLEFLLLNRNPKLAGGIPESFSKLSALRTALFDRTGLSGSLEGVCGLPTFNEPDADLC